MKRIARILILMASAVMLAVEVQAQVFARGDWEQANLLSAKVSQLYYEMDLGINVRPQKAQADFVYLAFGYGHPTTRNAWRKFMPAKNIPADLPRDVQMKLFYSGTDDLHAGKVGVGWNHWFNHAVGFYVQAGWGFVADLSAGSDLTEEEQTLLSDGEQQKGTFIYNTVPVEAGLTLSLWKHYVLQGGVTYQWKEIPLLTVGVGYTF